MMEDDIKKWLELGSNRRKVRDAFPFVMMTLGAYILLGVATDFLFVTLFFLILGAIGGGIFGLYKVYSMLDDWAARGKKR